MKKNTVDKRIAFIAAVLVAISAGAQSRHQFSINAGGGLSSLQYNLETGKNKTGFGGTLGLDYTYFFSEKWGISTGLSGALFNGKYELSNLREVVYTEWDDFQGIATTKNYSETQQAILLNIPLMLRFESGKFYAAIGAKVGIPLSTTYKSRFSEVETVGYFISDDFYIDDPEMGFGTFNGIDHKGDLKLKTAFFTSIEAGIKLGKFYTGLYLDYGLNNINNSPSQEQKLVPYTISDSDDMSTALIQIPNTLNSALSASIDNKRIVDKVVPLAAGIKIGFIFGGSKPKAKTVKPVDTQVAFDAQAEIERQQQAAEEARRKAEQKDAEERRKAEEARKLEEQRIAEQVRKAAEQRQYDDDMQTLLKPVDGYSINQSNPTATMLTELDKKAEILKRYPAINILVEGHACDIGDDAVNMNLGQRRADTAKKYLVEKGISADRITTASKGKTEPVAPNTSEENRKKNRRVQVKR
ncbi:MAG: OmpA family protein [Prevotellaceae bacterium]|jgi:outer membrane protein OmpA-like peptidoglycan-associated protein|nr:OmpA family protein [Prevotellaceae bacterium]